MPLRLMLEHGGRAVRVECMMVEVKSANDRLDARQEDWLNILDQHGNARVCKFEDTRKKRRTDHTATKESKAAEDLAESMES